jgi:hypothetical protein
MLTLSKIYAVKTRSWLAFCTGVSKVFSNRLLPIVRVEAVEVLPCVTSLAVYRVSIVVRVAANTLDCVGLLLFNRLDLVRHIVLGSGRRGGWRRRSGNRQLRRQCAWLVSHNLKGRRRALGRQRPRQRQDRVVYRRGVEGMTTPEETRACEIERRSNGKTMSAEGVMRWVVEGALAARW